MPSNRLPDADFNLPEMKTKSPSCPAGRVHMYDYHDTDHNKRFGSRHFSPVFTIPCSWMLMSLCTSIVNTTPNPGDRVGDSGEKCARFLLCIVPAVPEFCFFLAKMVGLQLAIVKHNYRLWGQIAVVLLFVPAVWGFNIAAIFWTKSKVPAIPRGGEPWLQRTSALSLQTISHLTFNIRISLMAIFLISGSSSDSTNFLIATCWLVSLFLHLNTTP